METITGIIDSFAFYNDENGYSVIRLEDGTVAVGLLPAISEGEEVELKGKWVNHPKYGPQFQFDEFQVLYPSTPFGIVKYLSSGLIKGIGETYAKKIVQRFGERTLDILDNSIDRLREIDGIGEKKLAKIKKSWESQKGVKEIMVYLQGQGISAKHSIKIYQTYGANAIEVVKNNPYQLTYDIMGIGFKSADHIAKNMGIDSNDKRRIKAAVVYFLSEASNDGHTFLPFENLASMCSSMLDYTLSYNDVILEELEEDNKIVVKNNKIYLPVLFFSETGIQAKIEKLLDSPPPITEENQKQLRFDKGKYSEEQLFAIKSSVQKKVLIITGGPGTGKTTTLKGIIDIYQKLEKKMLLAAPTGRAAKRMSELTGLESKTIHRLLKYNPMDGFFEKNDDDPLKTDLLIIDETSMIDTVLMFHLLRAVSTQTTLILVGDIDQLPSVGPGNVLKDLIASEIVPYVKLNKIFRQAKESNIIVAAHEINNGIVPNIDNKNSSDLFFINEQDPSAIPEKILGLCESRLPNAYDYDPIKDIQILSPMYKSDCGVDNINKIFQGELNKNEILFKRGNKVYKRFDKVMQLVNNYDKEVFNGDIGLIYSFNKQERTVMVDFNDRFVKYDFDDLDELTLAYAVTVHKSQGSEYPVIILPITTAHYIMLQRNLIYTAITRASELMILVGSKRALAIAVNNNKVKNRNTTLFKEKI